MHWIFCPAPTAAGFAPELSERFHHPPGRDHQVNRTAFAMLGVPGWLYVVEAGSSLLITTVEASLLPLRPVPGRERERAAAGSDELARVMDELKHSRLKVL